MIKKRRQLTVMGCFWDYHPLFRFFNRAYESRFISFYEPVLKGFVEREKIVLFGESNAAILLWPFKIIARSIKIFFEIVRFKPHIVISHHDDANISILPVLFFFKMIPFYSPRFILWIRNNPVQMHKRGVFSLVARFSYNFFFQFADSIIVQCEKNLDILSSNYPKVTRKLRVIPNVYDLNEIKMLAREDISLDIEELFGGKFVFINTGRLTEQKGQWHLIRAFKEISLKHPESMLVILGSGELESLLKNLVKALSLEGRVHFLGYQSNPFPILSRSNCFVLTSLYEGFPNVLVESLALNLPIISTNCDSGPRDILSCKGDSVSSYDISYSRYGMLIPPFLPEQLLFSSPISKDITEQELPLIKAMSQMISDASVRERYSRGANRAKDFSVDSSEMQSLLLDL